jgi:sugar phosphate isomerase/epimerase
MKPRLAAFPKCFMDELCVQHTMAVTDWIDLAATLGLDGVEFYSGFLHDGQPLLQIKEALARHSLAMPMLCCSPDFTQPDPEQLQKEIEREQRMTGLKREDGVAQVVRVIKGLLPFAQSHGVVLTMENHYKDNYWQYPEFAQKMDVFLEIVGQIDSPWFGVNYDPSNTILAGEDPLLLLDRIKHRVVTMHASDRFLKYGTIEDLRKEETSVGYASRLSHGVIGKGMNDYDQIFSTLAGVGFSSWISIEDGENGMDELRESVKFLRGKIDQHFPDGPGRAQ